jgi:hypothetical protein
MTPDEFTPLAMVAGAPGKSMVLKGKYSSP